jgi:hypothetical protein
MYITARNKIKQAKGILAKINGSLPIRIISGFDMATTIMNVNTANIITMYVKT